MTDGGGHTERTVRGVVWNFFRVMSQTFLSVGVMAVLARLLVPEDFGLMTLSMIFIGFANLLSSMGMGQALIQRASLSDRDIRLAGTLSVLMGSVLLAFFWLTAEPVALFFDSPRMTDILRALALGLWLTSFAEISRALLMRKLEFRQLFGIELVAYVLGHGITSISLALAGYGVWSLVVGNVVALAVSSILFIFFVRPPLKPLWNLHEARELLSFGFGVSVNSTVNYMAVNADYAVIGKYMNDGVLGLYSRAYHLVTLPLTRISATLTGVMFSSYSEIQTDIARVKRAYLLVVSATSLLTLPILSGFVVAGELLIVGLFGEQWREASEVFRILCVAGMIKSVAHLAGSVVQATGNVYSEVKRQVIYLVMLLIGCLFAVPYGINAVAVAVVIASVWLYLSMAQLALQVVCGNWGEFFRAQIPGLMLSLTVVAGGLAFRWLDEMYWHASTWVGLVAVIAVSGISYLVGVLFLPRKLIGETPAWLLQRLEGRLPDGVMRYVSQLKPFTSVLKEAVDG